MLISRLLIALSLLTLTCSANAKPNEDTASDFSIEGRWLTHQSIVRVEGCESGICGFVESLRLPEEIDQTTLLDVKNKDRSLQSRRIIGLNLFSRFDSITPGKSEYLKGRVYHPDHGRFYKANLRLLESGGVGAAPSLHARGVPIDPISRSSPEKATPALARGQMKQVGFFDALIHGATTIFLFPGLGKSLKVLRSSDAFGS